jgi:hypothetical protein
MPCNKCMLFVHDTLLHPPHPSSRHAPHFKRNRLLGCIQTVTYLLTRQIEDDRPDMIEWLNMMEMMNCAILNKDATREYRMYQIWLTGTNMIDEIITILIEHAILAKTKDRYPYEEWFAEKGIFLLQNLRQIHTEHSGEKFIKIKINMKKDDYDGLYD